MKSECSEDRCFVKNGSNMYLGVDGVKELVIICDHAHFSCKNEWTQDCFLSSKGAGPWQNPCDTDTGNERSMKSRFQFNVSACTPISVNNCNMMFAYRSD